jgi:hypothetical protein
MKFSGSTQGLSDRDCFKKFVSDIYQISWITYAKKPFGGPAQVLRYLAAYTHRVALSNRRILHVSDTQVTLSYKDYRNGCRRKELRLTIDEFLRRFCLHIQTRGFVRIRQYGLLAYRDRKQRIGECRKLIAKKLGKPKPTSPATMRAVVVLVALMAIVGSCTRAELIEATAAAAREWREANPSAAVEPTPCPYCGGRRETMSLGWLTTCNELSKYWNWYDAEKWDTS